MADDSSLRGAVRLEGRDAIRGRSLGGSNLTKFSKAKCKVLHLSWSNPKYRQGGE